MKMICIREFVGRHQTIKIGDIVEHDKSFDLEPNCSYNTGDAYISLADNPNNLLEWVEKSSGKICSWNDGWIESEEIYFITLAEYREKRINEILDL